MIKLFKIWKEETDLKTVSSKDFFNEIGNYNTKNRMKLCKLKIQSGKILIFEKFKYTEK